MAQPMVKPEFQNRELIPADMRAQPAVMPQTTSPDATSDMTVGNFGYTPPPGSTMNGVPVQTPPSGGGFLNRFNTLSSTWAQPAIQYRPNFFPRPQVMAASPYDSGGMGGDPTVGGGYYAAGGITHLLPKRK